MKITWKPMLTNAVSTNIEEFVITNSNDEKLLGIKTDNKLLFENHASSLCKKTSQKLHALARIVNNMDLSKRKCLIKAFVTSQFNYCPLIWMFHSRELNKRINSIHERALRLVYQDNSLSFAELLQKDNSVTIHQRNLQVHATEIFKLKNRLAPEIMKEIFEIQNPAYNFRSEATYFNRENVRWCAVSADFLGDSSKGISSPKGISSLGNWVKFIFFCAVVATIFCICYYVCYLFIYYYCYYYYY